MVGKKQPDETPPVDDAAGMAAQRPELHQSPFTVFRVQTESRPHEHRGAGDAETDAHPLVDARHVHDGEHHEQGEQTAGEDEQVLAFQPLELGAAADPLVYRILRHVTGRMSAGWLRLRSGRCRPRTTRPPSWMCPGRRTRTWSRPSRLR